MKSILLAWIGRTDLRAPAEPGAVGVGPIAQALDAMQFDQAVLLSNYPKGEEKDYLAWIKKRSDTRFSVRQVSLTSPTNYSEIYRQVVDVCQQVLGDKPDEKALTFHLSPGTPAMAAIWLLLAKTRYSARLIESSREHGVKEVDIPFELAAEFTPRMDSEADDSLTNLMQGLPPEAPAFDSIIHRCPAMKRTVAMARRLATRELAVLIQGESGTGKELFARAIHRASRRQKGPFVAVNCGAIPQELVDAELFGHEKGAFTGAITARPGYFESADGGTLFLDEIGELPLASQVRLLRVLQEREVTRVGATKAKKIDTRIIAATNRVLPIEIQAGRFREDLFHRIAVGVLLLPPLRAREGDVSLLIDALLKGINAESEDQPGYKHKKLDAGARNIMLRHSWPGNVRELHNTLVRATLWASGEYIKAPDISEALAVTIAPQRETILGRPLNQPVSLPDILAEVSRHYLERAMAVSHGNKAEASRLLGLGSYQTLSNWMQKYEVG